MSLVFRRGLSTIVPPKVATVEQAWGTSATSYINRPVNKLTKLQGLGAKKGTARIERIVSFYSKLPKGPAPESTGGGVFGWYKRKYFGKNPSAAPLWHAIFGLLIIGYSQEYYFHLRHHKNNAH